MSGPDPVSEWELKATAKAPRVSNEDVENFIVSETYFTASEGAIGAGGGAGAPTHPALDLLTFCVLVLANGFTVHGISACASRENYNAGIGQRLAREDAKNKIWQLLGFELRSKLAMVERAPQKSSMVQGTFVGRKVVHAAPMTRADYNILRGWELPSDENGNDDGYLVEYADGGQANVAGFDGYVSWSPKDVFERAYERVG